MDKPSDEKIAAAINEIKGMSQVRMAELQRYAPIGHIMFRNDLPTVRKAWDERRAEVGGMTPAISKMIDR